MKLNKHLYTSQEPTYETKQCKDPSTSLFDGVDSNKGTQEVNSERNTG